MVIVRPVHLADLDNLEALAALTGIGLTTLPKDREYLTKRIRNSERAFQSIPDKPAGESYLFVMEDLATHAIIGACGIVSKVGGFEPFYSYSIEKTHFHSDVIGVNKEVPILKLHEEHDGPAEIGSLFLHPDFRHDGNGRLLQLVRFLFIAEHPDAFEQTIVSEIRGVSDDNGRSPFWDAIGLHFFDIDFRRADYLSIVNKHFIADLMPDHPIYIPLLPKEAQNVIGVPHEQSKSAVKNLQLEGFTFANEVDIFDAGPVVQCPRDQIRTIRQSQRAIISEIVGKIESPRFMIARSAGEFRACQGQLDITPTGVRITKEIGDALKIKAGESIRFSPMPEK
ncbi:MAG TPA: arginine N-succinyltransferase [Tepidisphaeraceae bacterium]|jgi:arginine N-succinyltransferase|nr:arginine N-succinyltransferase [Tepidisphaeraceae bacterium]